MTDSIRHHIGTLWPKQVERYFYQGYTEITLSPFNYTRFIHQYKKYLVTHNGTTLYQRFPLLIKIRRKHPHPPTIDARKITLIQLYRHQGKTYQEIGNLVGVSHETARKYSKFLFSNK